MAADTQVPAEYGHAWQAFVTVVGEDAPLPRGEIMGSLHAAGIAARPGTHYSPDLGLYRDGQPRRETLSDRGEAARSKAWLCPCTTG